MLVVHFRRDSRDRLSSFFAEGHAEAGDYGEDIVCAAVSSVLQAAWLGLDEHAKLALVADRTSERLEVAWPESERERTDVVAIVRTAELAVAQIASQYPKNVRVVYEAEAGQAANAGYSTPDLRERRGAQ
jgi:uncharacterized protein YsxB (DUF464 family)